VRRWVRALFVCSAVLGFPGCFLKKDLPIDGPVIADVELIGAGSIDEERLKDGLATRRSPKFLFWRGIAYDYEVLDEALLERDLDRVERFYRAQGYYEAKVVSARVVRTDAHTVDVVIAVSEGAKVMIPESSAGGAIAVQINGLESIEDTRLVSKLIRSSLKPGTFVEGDYEDSKRELRQLLLDNGYAHAQVTGKVEIDLARHEARVTYDLAPGRLCRIGPISIQGLRKIPETKVRQSVLLESGDRYSAAELEDARRALVTLGVFSSVSVEPDLSHPEQDRIPVTFVVGETAPRTLRLGVGVNLDSLQFATRLTAGWEHRNFLGGLRHLSVEARPGAVLFPTRIDNLSPPDRVLFTNQFRVSLDQPGFIEGRTRGTLSTELNVRPLLYTDTGTEEAIIGFLESKNQAGLERAFLSHRLLVTPSLNWQAEIPIDYRNLSVGYEPSERAESGLDNVFVAYPELLLQYDLRDNPTEPTRGVYLSNSLQVAVPVLGGNVSDVRIQPEVRAYATKHRLTLALRATTGLLFPSNYGDTLKGRVNSILTPAQIRDQQKLLFRAFFSGGPFSNRGYPVNGVGPHYVLGYLGNPGQRCAVVEGEPVDPSCLRPVGGLTLWELSLELRFPLSFLEPLTGALFLDSSDVREQALSFGIGDPHVSPGIGLRYPTPIGPIRADFGLRLFELLGKEERQGTPPSLLGQPITISFAVGEAF
jgi:outer membrane protein insertion porin family/translocation and assembly module TamA